MSFMDQFGMELPHAETFMFTESFKEQSKLNKEDLVQKNLHLIDKCISTKRTDLVSEDELRALGKIALNTFAQDSFYSFGFEKSVLRKIEKMMNIAIAEAAYIKEVQNNISKKDLCTEFTSIYERFP